MSSGCSIVGDEAALAAPEDRSHEHCVFRIAGYACLPDGPRHVAGQLGAGWRVREPGGAPSGESPPTVEWFAAAAPVPARDLASS
ncbi:hypothetical protein BFF94_033170 [Burkholderia catarinensis]|nr:hypothetical protein BFF94_033170 [Burkholderia catarinensis]